MSATISPDLPSLLTRDAAAGGGAVPADVTLVTCADRLSWSAISVPTARAAVPLTPSGADTTNSSCTSPWPNLSVRILVALADSDVGSWNPPADRLLATGTPKMPAATSSSVAMAMVRLGATIARHGVRWRRTPRCTRGIALFTVRGVAVLDRPMPPAMGTTRPLKSLFQHSVTFVNG